MAWECEKVQRERGWVQEGTVLAYGTRLLYLNGYFGILWKLNFNVAPTGRAWRGE